jgi:ribosomal protein S1
METVTDAAPASAVEPKAHFVGKVTKTTLAGAIIDIGQKVPGVVHISQLRAEPVNRVEDVVQVGQEVNVWVRRVRDDRIELTMVEPLALEWREIKPDMIVKGKVARLESYGAFVDFGAERPGLVHVSEIAHGFLKTPSEKLHEGDEVEAKVLEVNRRKKQIRLSIKAALPEPEEAPVEVKPEPRRKGGKGEKRGKERKEDDFVEEQEPHEPELTAFQIAFQKAEERSGKSIVTSKKKKSRRRGASREHEDIFDRTLKNRITEK